MTQRLVGILPYDKFPYIVVKEISEITLNGKIKDLQGYFYSPPLIIVPFEVGMKLKEDADILNIHLDATLDRIHNEYLKRLIELFHSLPKVVTYLNKKEKT